MQRKQIEKLIAAGGGTLHAVQRVPAITIGKCARAYYIVFFHGPKHGSTLCRRLKGLTPEIVSQHIAESNKRFGLA